MHETDIPSIKKKYFASEICVVMQYNYIIMIVIGSAIPCRMKKVNDSGVMFSSPHTTPLIPPPGILAPEVVHVNKHDVVHIHI